MKDAVLTSDAKIDRQPYERPSGSHPAIRIAMFALKFAIAGGIIYWLLHKDFHKFVESLCSARLEWLALAALIVFAQLGACAFRWRMLLLSQGIEIGFIETFSLYLQGSFFSLAIPGGAVGGDLVKAGIIASRAPAGKKLEGALSIVVDRIAGMIALFGLLLAATPLLWWMIARLEPALKTAFGFLIAISVFGLLCAAVFPFYEMLLELKPLQALSLKADSLSKGAIGRMLEAARIYKSKWRTLLGAIAVSAFIANPLMIGGLYCLVIGVSGVKPDIGATAVSMLFGGAASAIPLTPGGIGTRDAVCKAGLMAGGVDAGAATAATLLFTTIMVCISLAGGLLFAFDVAFRKKVAVLDNVQ